MSEITLKIHGKRAPHLFVGSSFNALFQGTGVHYVRWQADKLADKISTRYQLSGDMKLGKSELLFVVGMEYHANSIGGNLYIGSPDAEGLKLF
jgi:hypothetical protein